MKKIAFLSLLLALAFSGFSQVKKDRTKLSDSTKQSIREAMKNRKDKNGRMAELNLSREQKKQVRDLKKEDEAAKESINNDKTLTEEQKKEKLKELRKARQEKIKSMLTPEQKEKLKSMNNQP